MATRDNGGGLLPVRKVEFTVHDLTKTGNISYKPLSDWGETDHTGSKIHVSTFELSSKGDDGSANTARVYQVDGVGGAGGLRYMPIAQLVMAICFARAAEKEAEVVKLMNTIAATSQNIENLSYIENILAEFEETGVAEKPIKVPNGTAANGTVPDPSGSGGAGGANEAQKYKAYEWGAITVGDLPEGQDVTKSWTKWLSDQGVDVGAEYMTKSPLAAADVSAILEQIESKLDSLNTTSQKDMITLQSETTKRDQTYDLISAIIKSISTGNTSIDSNLR